MLAIMNPSTSSNLTVDDFQWMPKLSEDNCAVCGDQVKSNRLGCPACLSCMLFFRRSVIKNAEYRCGKGGDCNTFIEFRSSCRHCRYQKCFRAGMKACLVITRDTIGPRSPPAAYLDVPRVLMDTLLEIQMRQWEDHEDKKIEPMRRASLADVNKMFKWSFNNSVEWASQFEPFLRLSNEHQKCVVSERHHEFVTFLETTIKRQFQIMQIDEFETAVLKTLLLFSNSFPKQNIFSEYQEKIEKLKNKCLEELMAYLEVKFPTSHETRFGKLLLFIGDIRSAIKVVYNQTKVSDLFDSTKFDMFVRSFFLS